MIRIIQLFILLTIVSIVSTEAKSLKLKVDSSLIKLLTKEQLTDCPTYILNAKQLIPTYYLNHNLDSVFVLIDFLEVKCGAVAEEFAALRNLLAIEDGTYGDLTCDDLVKESVLNTNPYGWHHLYSTSSGIRFSSATLCGPDDSDYNKFIETLVKKLLKETDSSSVGNLYCQYLLGDYDKIIMRLHNGEFTETCLGKAYQQEISDVKRKLADDLRDHYGFSGGIWLPRDGAKVVGNKIEIGAQAGVYKKRFMYRASLIFRFLKSAHSYDVKYEGELLSTDRFFGGYIGGEVGIETIRAGRFALDLFAGIGYDGWDAIDESSDVHKGINSFNFNLGGTARIFYNKERTRYWGLQGRYNFVKYSNSGGTNLRGNTISLNLVYGYIGNSWTVNRANYLLVYD